ncbi:MAG: GWxTD domain-containing protein [Calditrichaeota bacterium]|nr:GWxTD domain-containing protein [Calditrichota bacterium]
MARTSAWGGREAGRGPTATCFVRCCNRLIFLVLFWGLIHASAGTWKKNELKIAHPAVHIDYGLTFDPQTESSRLWCAVSVKAQNFVFLRDGQRFWADVELECLLMRPHSGVVATRIYRDTLLAGDYRQTHDADEYRLFQFRLPVEAGKYQLRIVVRDRISRKEAIWEEEFDVQLPDSRLAVSDIQLAHRGVIFDQNNLKYSRGVVLYPERLFGLPEPKLFYYFEIYSREWINDQPVEIQVRLRTPDHRNIPVLFRQQRLKIEKFPVFGTIETDTLPPGEYFLVATVKSANGRVAVQKAKSFWVYQNPADLRFRPYEAVLAELRLIATREEMAYLKKIPHSLRQQAVDRFWELRDPTPMTPANEVMTEFYRRVLFARMYFENGNLNDPHLSDRSKVYIVYGRPDKVLRNSNPLLRKNVEVWIYQRLEIQAIFLDEYGFGDYRLVEPFSLLQD